MKKPVKDIMDFVADIASGKHKTYTVCSTVMERRNSDWINAGHKSLFVNNAEGFILYSDVPNGISSYRCGDVCYACDGNPYGLWSRADLYEHSNELEPATHLRPIENVLQLVSQVHNCLADSIEHIACFKCDVVLENTQWAPGAVQSAHIDCAKSFDCMHLNIVTDAKAYHYVISIA